MHYVLIHQILLSVCLLTHSVGALDDANIISSLSSYKYIQVLRHCSTIFRLVVVLYALQNDLGDLRSQFTALCVSHRSVFVKLSIFITGTKVAMMLLYL